ncbi:hypothetical protein QJS10_CPA06g01713 [Acorus calamus]|uniref:Bromo domain-containing protein n=1 Tax=Acorus calamus TaxID=4465 RepID=A0AAV9ENN5_ACOCL|nr:hypothetical protein QJS10_CPA06g01713 [Acorus calamus]
MTKLDGQDEIWGTLEELLLASAVHRHGTRSWDSVAAEVQNRIHLPLTAQSCKYKFHDLRRRFETKDHQIDAGDGATDAAVDVPWIDELRKLRVAELRQEVQRFDMSIVSLQMKVKRLTEERERSVREGEGKADLTKDDLKGDDEGARPAVGGDSGRSCNDSRNKETDAGTGSAEPDQAEVQPGGADPAAAEDGGDRPAGEASFNGSSDTVAKGGAAASPPVEAAEPVEPVAGGESAEFRESVAESKESSDVQSSASLSRRGRLRKKKRRSSPATASAAADEEAEEETPVGDGGGDGGRCGGGGEDGKEHSHARGERVAEKSKPLFDFLIIIRSHKSGSVFDRLEIQEISEYKSLIKQHVDLEMVRRKVLGGRYPPDQRSRFFRDLLLLFNNAIAFFPKESPESAAALELRSLVSREVGASESSLASRSVSEKDSKPSDRPPSTPPEVKPVEADLIKNSLPPKRGPILIACRKRSSISAKAAAAAPVVDEKPNLETEEAKPEPKKTRSAAAAPSSGTRGLRTSKVSDPNSKQGLAVAKKPAPAAPPAAETPPSKAEKKSGGGTSATSVAKKRSAAANFLNRMKKGGVGRSSSSPTNGTLLESLKSSAVAPPSSASGGGGGRGETKRGGGSASTSGGGRREQGSRHGSGGKQEAKAAEVKRGVGRPPKRAAAPPPQKTAGKRTRETEAETPPSKQPPRKRGRK